MRNLTRSNILYRWPHWIAFNATYIIYLIRWLCNTTLWLHDKNNLKLNVLKFKMEFESNNIWIYTFSLRMKKGNGISWRALNKYFSFEYNLQIQKVILCHVKFTTSVLLYSMHTKINPLKLCFLIKLEVTKLISSTNVILCI